MRHRPIPLDNKAVVHRYYEAFNKQNLVAMEEVYAPDMVAHAAGFPDMDLAGAKQGLTAFFTAFPDANWVVEDLIAEGDKVVCRWTMRGTHRGEFMGIPPTGKQVSWTEIAIERIEDDRFVEAWGNADLLGLMQQLGAIPQMAQTGA